MMLLVDLTGQRFGRLTVISRAETVNKRTRWLCRCDCGKEVIAEAYNLKTGHTQSCGCLQSEAASIANTKHGGHGTRLYRIWVCMKNRCYHTSYHAYNHYGGRGIVVCDEWKDNFRAFQMWATENGYADNLSIDRIDSNGIYCPENCRWATTAEQNQKKRVKNGYKIEE